MGNRFPPTGNQKLYLVQSVLVTTPVPEIIIREDIHNFDFLTLKISGRSTGAGTLSTVAKMRYNGDAGTNYAFSRVNRFGSSNSAAANYLDIGDVALAGAASGRFHFITLDIAYPADTNRRKSMSGLSQNATDLTAQMISGEWFSTSPIIFLTLFLASGNWDTNTRVTVLGMQKE